MELNNMEWSLQIRRGKQQAKVDYINWVCEDNVWSTTCWTLHIWLTNCGDDSLWAELVPVRDAQPYIILTTHTFFELFIRVNNSPNTVEDRSLHYIILWRVGFNIRTIYACRQ